MPAATLRVMVSLLRPVVLGRITKLPGSSPSSISSALVRVTLPKLGWMMARGCSCVVWPAPRRAAGGCQPGSASRRSRALWLSTTSKVSCLTSMMAHDSTFLTSMVKPNARCASMSSPKLSHSSVPVSPFSSRQIALVGISGAGLRSCSRGGRRCTYVTVTVTTVLMSVDCGTGCGSGLPISSASRICSSDGRTRRSVVMVSKLNSSRFVISHGFMFSRSERRVRRGSAKGALSSATMSVSVSCFRPSSGLIRSAYASMSSSSSWPWFLGSITFCSISSACCASSTPFSSLQSTSKASMAILRASVYDSGWIRVASAAPPPARITRSSSLSAVPTCLRGSQKPVLLVTRRNPAQLVHTTLRSPAARTMGSRSSSSR
mmetsp:Transcript_25811/g.68094  ORF Transcript_25811/g.68094 Transcript_25811/m.68094 type:complete len:376 (+) Transcript_25811:548-1675(+)